MIYFGYRLQAPRRFGFMHFGKSFCCCNFLDHVLRDYWVDCGGFSSSTFSNSPCDRRIRSCTYNHRLSGHGSELLLVYLNNGASLEDCVTSALRRVFRHSNITTLYLTVPCLRWRVSESHKGARMRAFAQLQAIRLTPCNRKRKSYI